MDERNEIDKLESKLSIRLPLEKEIASIGSQEPCYVINKRKQIIGLNLVGLGLKSIPKEVYNLKHLIQLNLGVNLLKEISNEIIEIAELNTIGLYDNKFEDFPDTLLEHPKLQKIYIQNNHISELSIKKLEEAKLELLLLRGNPINIPPEFIDDSNPQKILSYLKSLENNSRKISEVKIILVGDGSSGKTSLVKRIINNEFDIQESQTHGININPWIIRLAEFEQPIKINFWDFGGQEIMHATHQFFMSKRSIYFLILNAREEPNPEYWLKSIRSFGGKSPIFIIINKIDENPSFDLNRKFLSSKYPSIIGYFRTSCLNEEGIPELKNRVLNSLHEIPHITENWSSNWFKVKETLEKSESAFISLDDYQDLCTKHKITNANEQQVLIEFLNDLGVILHFKEMNLYDTHVLDPLWITTAVYKILNSETLAKNSGVLSFKDLEQILYKSSKKYSYPKSKFKYIMELMKKFELTYEVDDNNFLIPDLLPVQEPEIAINNSRKIVINIQYEFLPKSILPRLIVNMSEDIHDGLRWRTGVILKDSKLNSTAIVRADYDKNELKIIISGNRKREYLSIIIHFINRINSSFENLNCKEMLPLPDNPNIQVSVNHLYRLEELNQETYFPDGADKQYKVKELLGGLSEKKGTEEELLLLLSKIGNKLDDQETLLKKANDIVQLKPNFFGIGLDLNAVVDKFRKKTK